MNSSNGLSPFSWKNNDVSTPNLKDKELIKEISHTNHLISQRIDDLRRTIEINAFHLTSSARQQQERLREYKNMLLSHKTMIISRANWVKEAIAAVERHGGQQSAETFSDLDVSTASLGPPLMSEPMDTESDNQRNDRRPF